MAGDDTILFQEMTGKNLYALRPVKLYRKGKVIRTAQKNTLIGKMKRWAIDDSGVLKSFKTDWSNVAKLVSKYKLVIIFEGGKKGDYAMYVDPKGGQIDMKSLIEQGARTTAQMAKETQEKYDKSPLDAATAAATAAGGEVVKKYWPLVAAGLITIILIKKI